MVETKKCDGCHKKRKLHFFKHLTGGYSAYCRNCAIHWGYGEVIEHRKTCELRAAHKHCPKCHGGALD